MEKYQLSNAKILRHKNNAMALFIILFSIGAISIILGVSNPLFEVKEIFRPILGSVGGVFVAISLTWFIESKIVKVEENYLHSVTDHHINVQVYALLNFENGRSALERVCDVLTKTVNLFSPIKKEKGVKNRLIRNLITYKYNNQLRDLTHELSDMDEGKIRFFGQDSIKQSTGLFYGKSKEVFAVSWPDIEYWNKAGKSFLEEQEKMINNGNIKKIERFFIVRTNNCDEDAKLFSEDSEKIIDSFVNVIVKQIKCGISVYLATSSQLDIPYEQLHDPVYRNNQLIPDFSIFDNQVSSTWVDDYYTKVTYNNGKKYVETLHRKGVIIDYNGEYFKDAIILKSFLQRIKHNFAIDAPSTTDGSMFISRIKGRILEILSGQ